MKTRFYFNAARLLDDICVIFFARRFLFGELWFCSFSNALQKDNCSHFVHPRNLNLSVQLLCSVYHSEKPYTIIYIIIFPAYFNILNVQNLWFQLDPSDTSTYTRVKS